MPSRTFFLLPARYKNISFLVRKETIDEIGQKNIVHDYAHTSSRYVEQQGKKPFSATIDIFFSGLGWKSSYKSFKAALENSSPGRLILPTFGIINNVVAIQASASATQTEVGEISLTITFTETIERPSPTESDATSEDVFSKGADSRSSLSESFSNNYQSPSTMNNKLTAINDFVNLAAIVNDITGLAFATASFTRNLPKYLNSPSGMATILLNQVSPIGLLQSVAMQDNPKSFSNVKKIAVCGNNLSNAMNDIREESLPKSFTMPDAMVYNPIQIDTTIQIWDDSTLERKQRTNNRYCAVNVFRIAGLISLLENASKKTYYTTIDVNKVNNIIDLYYGALVENDKTNVIIPEIKDDLDNLKTLTENVLSNKRQKACNVIEIKIERPYPTKLLSYDLYGEYIKNEEQLSAIASLIKGLNSSLPAHALQGTVRILEKR